MSVSASVSIAVAVSVAVHGGGGRCGRGGSKRGGRRSGGSRTVGISCELDVSARPGILDYMAHFVSFLVSPFFDELFLICRGVSAEVNCCWLRPGSD